MHPDAPRIGGALLVLGAVALIVTQVDAGSGRARTSVGPATGAAVLSKSVGGDAILRAGDMKPGDRVSGTVTVKNDGDATGVFRLAQNDVLDVPGSGGGQLSKKLNLTVDDTGTGRQVYRGVLGAMRVHPLGYLRPGEQHAYRFTLAYPVQPPDDAYAGSRVETTFDWTADTRSPPAGPGRDTAPPAVVAQVVPTQGTVTVALTCSERCTLAGVSGGTATAPHARLTPGRPLLLPVVTAYAGRPLRITVADAAGNRATVNVPVAR